MFVGQGMGENTNLKEFAWRTIFKIFSPKYQIVRRTNRSQYLVVLTQFLVVEDTRTRKFCYTVQSYMNFKLNEDVSGPLSASIDNTGRSPVLTGELVPVDWHGLPVQVLKGPLRSSLSEDILD